MTVIQLHFLKVCKGASQVVLVVKHLPANVRHEMWVRSLGWEKSLVVGNRNPLQYSCLENLTARGAWWATVHRIAESDMTEVT